MLQTRCKRGVGSTFHNRYRGEKMTPRARLTAALRLAVFAAGLLALTSGWAIAQPAGVARYEGILTIIWGDPRPGQPGGETRFHLTLPDGTTYRLQIDPAQQSSAMLYFSKRVAVQGRLASNAIVEPTITVDQIEGLEPAQGSAVDEPKAVTRKVLFILLKYKNDNQEPHPKKFYLDRLPDRESSRRSMGSSRRRRSTICSGMAISPAREVLVRPTAGSRCRRQRPVTRIAVSTRPARSSPRWQMTRWRSPKKPASSCPPTTTSISF
jgi:hypothetical protein